MFLRTTSSAFAVLALTAPAFADITPAQVWQNWVDYYKANGYTVTEGSRDEAGETLTVRDVVVGMQSPKNDAKVEFRLPEVTLTGTGDGKVRTTMAETSTAVMDFKDDEDQHLVMNGTLTMKGSEIVSSGDAADMTHESRADEIVATLDSLQVDGKDRKLPVTLRIVKTAGRQHFVDGQLIKVDAEAAAERLEFSGNYERGPDVEAKDAPERVSFEGSVDGLKGSGTSAIPKGVDISKDLNAALKAGMAVSGTVSATSARMTFDARGKDENDKDVDFKGSTAANGFDLTAAMSADGLSYQAASDDSSVELTSSELPAPISYSIGNGTADVQLPIMKSDAPVPFKIAYSVGGIKLGDSIWDLFDSARVLPRDPASLDLDLTGLVKLAVDPLDPATMKALEEADDEATADDAAADGKAEGSDSSVAAAADAAKPADATDDTAMDDTTADDTATDDTAAEPQPFEVTEFNLNKLALDVAGAKIDASGTLSVPPGGSIEEPVGTLSARMEGVNTLIDNLVKMGLIPQDQVTTYRMMLAMFAKPAPEGGDALVSDFEFKEGGQIFANGAQVK